MCLTHPFVFVALSRPRIKAISVTLSATSPTMRTPLARQTCFTISCTKALQRTSTRPMIAVCRIGSSSGSLITTGEEAGTDWITSPAAARKATYCSVASSVNGQRRTSVRIGADRTSTWERKHRFASKSPRRDFEIGTNEDVLVQNNSHGRQLRCGRTLARASEMAASISSGVVSAVTCEAM